MLRDPCISLLRELIAIDSVNPSLVPGATGEGPIAAALAAHLRRLGLDVEVQDVRPGRPNVVGTLTGRSAGPSLMFCGHLDTVGVEGMAAPFDPVERNGRIHGRGSQDMKGGVAAMVDAARVVASEGVDRGRLIVAAVVDEEYESLGADALVTRWQADAAVVTEPTDLQIGIAHKGFAWLDVVTHGRAAHGSRPQDGRDAILRMGRVLQRLEALDSELQARPPHPLLGAPSLHASIIRGGTEISSYPARCELQVERRTVPGEPAGGVEEEGRTLVERLAREDPEFQAEVRLRFARPAHELASDHALPAALRAVLHDMGVGSGPVGMSFWTDAAVLGMAGIPSVLFGPGGAGLHSPDEYVTTADVLTCRDALVRLASRYLRS